MPSQLYHLLSRNQLSKDRWTAGAVTFEMPLQQRKSMAEEAVCKIKNFNGETRKLCKFNTISNELVEPSNQSLNNLHYLYYKGHYACKKHNCLFYVVSQVNNPRVSRKLTLLLKLVFENLCIHNEIFSCKGKKRNSVEQFPY